MTTRFQIGRPLLPLCAVFLCSLSLMACSSTDSSSLNTFDAGSAQAASQPDSPGIAASASYASTDPLYQNLPTGPRDTGTYPDIRDEPEIRIVDVSEGEVQALKNQMAALAADHASGRISTAAYNRRLAYLRRLAQNHSSDMLEQIGEPAG